MHTRKPPDLIGTKADQITPKQPGAEIGQRKRLSEKDVEGLNEYYECGKNFVQLSLKKIDFYLCNNSVFIFTFISYLPDPGSIDTTTQIEDSNCPPDKLLENGCVKWASFGMCGGTWMDENCPTSCNSC